MFDNQSFFCDLFVRLHTFRSLSHRWFAVPAGFAGSRTNDPLMNSCLHAIVLLNVQFRQRIIVIHRSFFDISERGCIHNVSAKREMGQVTLNKHHTNHHYHHFSSNYNLTQPTPPYMGTQHKTMQPLPLSLLR